MRNGTRSNKLTLVDNNGMEISSKSDVADTSVEYVSDNGEETAETPSQVDEALHNKWLFVVVSVTCAVAAIAAGSYAAWLSRRRVAQDAITNVHDLLETCQARMHEIENDLNSMSKPAAQSNG